MSVASPVAPGDRVVDARAAWKLSAEVPERSTLTATATTTTSAAVVATPASEETTGRLPPAWTSLSLDASAQRRRRLDPFPSAPRERDRPLLLSESVGELQDAGTRASSDTLFRCERPVGERRQLGDLPIPPSCARRRLIDTAPKGNAEPPLAPPEERLSKSGSAV